MDILDGSESGHDDGILSKTVLIRQFDEHWTGVGTRQHSRVV